VRGTQSPTVLAEAADVLSDQLRTELILLAELTAPHAELLERRFLSVLRKQKRSVAQQIALNAITIGAAARTMTTGGSLAAFFEQVAYSGRRLAKLNFPPNAIAAALREYDQLLTPVLAKAAPRDNANLSWAREQLQFCTVLTLNNCYYQVRETETKAFYDLFRAELEAKQLDGLLERFVAALKEFTRADEGCLYLLNTDGDAWIQHVGSTDSVPAVQNKTKRWKALGQPVCGPAGGKLGLALNTIWQQRFQTCWSVPLTVEGRVTGVMQFAFAKSYEWLPREQEMLSAASERCSVAVEKARLIEDLAARQEQIRRLAEHMLHVEEVERRRISRELHDEAGQSMLWIRLQMEMIENDLPAEQAALKDRLKNVRENTERTILEIRRLIAALSPAVLEQLGLGAALRQLVNRFRLYNTAKVKLQVHRLAELPKETEVMVYRLVQECFNNIAKHSSANTVNLSVGSDDGILSLSVEDNGVGFCVEEALAKRESYGLAGMRERVALLGGQFEVRSGSAMGKGAGEKKARPARPGTRIMIQLPIPKEGIW
jgi:signal transduction histidine kinase